MPILLKLWVWTLLIVIIFSNSNIKPVEAVKLSELLEENKGYLNVIHGTGAKKFILGMNGRGKYAISKDALINLQQHSRNISISIKQLPNEEVIKIPLLESVEEDLDVN